MKPALLRIAIVLLILAVNAPWVYLAVQSITTDIEDQLRRGAPPHCYNCLGVTSIVVSAVIVATILLLDVLILWLLTKIGGPLKADVKATIEKFGGNVWITGAGLVGAFLAIGIFAVGAIVLIAYFSN